MSGALALLALTQAAAWTVWPPIVTVGDTVQLIRRLQVPLEVRARVQPLTASAVVEPLADPTVTHDSGGMLVWYRVTLFEPGRQPVAMPTVELLRPDGSIEPVPGDTAWVVVRGTVVGLDSSPRPSLSPLPRTPRRLDRVILLGTVVVVGAAWWAASRRRGRRTPPPLPIATASPPPSLMRWVSAGELRGAATVVTERLRRRIVELVPEAGRSLSVEDCLTVLADRRPQWPLGDLGEVLRALEPARFAPAVPGDIAILADQADGVLAAIEAQGPEVSEVEGMA